MLSRFIAGHLELFVKNTLWTESTSISTLGKVKREKMGFFLILRKQIRPSEAPEKGDGVSIWKRRGVLVVKPKRN